jgi:hypothetical protein
VTPLGSLTAVVHALGLLALGLVGVAGLYGAAEQGASALRLARTPAGEAASLTEGLASVRGTARTDEPLTAPLSGEPCLAYELREWHTHVPAGGIDETALSLQGREWWEDESASETGVAAVAPFRVHDGTDAVQVRPHGEAEPATIDPREALDVADPAEAGGRSTPARRFPGR